MAWLGFLFLNPYSQYNIIVGKRSNYCRKMLLIRPFREWALISKREERKGFLVLGYPTMDENSIIARFGVKN